MVAMVSTLQEARYGSERLYFNSSIPPVCVNWSPDDGSVSFAFTCDRSVVTLSIRSSTGSSKTVNV